MIKGRSFFMVRIIERIDDIKMNQEIIGRKLK